MHVLGTFSHIEIQGRIRGRRRVGGEPRDHGSPPGLRTARSTGNDVDDTHQSPDEEQGSYDGDDEPAALNQLHRPPWIRSLTRSSSSLHSSKRSG